MCLIHLLAAGYEVVLRRALDLDRCGAGVLGHPDARRERDDVLVEQVEEAGGSMVGVRRRILRKKRTINQVENIRAFNPYQLWFLVHFDDWRRRSN